ncbi:MAG: response regulator [Magnetococcales bacterium]|nr:response regulator [Magnetococcales bacterium]MBF0156633.1 response regulator [Magnetococcales bacterium]
MSEESFLVRFRELRGGFVASLPARFVELRRLWEALEAAPLSLSLWDELHVRLHGLVGTAASYLLPELSEEARPLALLVRRLMGGKQVPDPVHREWIRAHLGHLERIARGSVETPFSPDGAAAAPSPAVLPLLSRVVILSVDESLARGLAQEVERHHYRLAWCSTPEGLRATLAEGAIAAIVVDLELMADGNGAAGLSLFEACGQPPLPVPVVALANDSELRTRLRSVRLGCTGFLQKPVDRGRILRALALWERDSQEEAFRVLVVDDDPHLTALYQAILEEAGMEVAVLNAPWEILGLLGRFKAELVILDHHMPGCTGIEMAAILRQDERRRELPLLLISSDRHLGRRLSDRHLDHQDHLVKPIAPAVLVRTVGQAVRRARSRDRIAEELRGTLRELENVQNAMNRHAIVSIVDRDGRISYVNDRFVEASGFSHRELIGESWELTRSRHHPASFYREQWEMIASGRVWHGEMQSRRKGGGHYWVEATIVPFLDEAGAPFEYVSIHTDITRQKRAEERAGSMALFTEMNPAPTLRVDAQGLILEANPAAKSVIGEGIRVGEPLGRSLPQVDDCGLGRLIREGLVNQIEVALGGRHYRFTVQGVAELKIAHLYGDNITASKEAEGKLLLAKETAEKANQAKSQFLSSMSHELRTPMNAVLGFAQLLESDPDEPLSESQRDSTREILKAGRHLLKLIDEILDLSKIEAGKIQLTMEDVAFGDVLADCLTLVSSLARERNIGLNSTRTPLSCGQYAVWADMTRLKQVLLNLLSNAIKYNREGGKVAIACEAVTDHPDEPRVRITIADTGPGIDELHLSTVFDPFNRLGAEGSEVKGTGIGLAIARRLMEMMGGSIGVESRLGKGSTFWIELARVPMRWSVGVEEGGGSESPRAQEFAGTSATVLYIEDNPANLKLVGAILRRRPGVRLLTSPSANLGLDLARAHQPEMILLDIHLPGMNGFQAMERLRTDPVTRAIPVVAVSAYATSGEVERGLAAGFVDYLTKPLEVARFLGTLDRVLKGKAGGRG